MPGHRRATINAAAAIVALAGAAMATGASAAPIALTCEGQGRVATLVRDDVGLFHEEYRQGPVRFEVKVDPQDGAITLDGRRTYRPAVTATEISFREGRFSTAAYHIAWPAGTWQSKDGSGVCRSASLTVASGF